MVSQFLEQSIPSDNVPCLPAFQLTEQRLCGDHVVSDSLQHCDLLPSSASMQENCAVGPGASARTRLGSKSSNCAGDPIRDRGTISLPMLPERLSIPNTPSTGARGGIGQAASMFEFLSLVLHVLASPFKTRARLEAEFVMLRHQLNVLRRRVRSKPKLSVADRLLFVWLYRLFPSVLNAVAIVQPETVIRWHRAGFRLYWRWKSRSRGGRPRVPLEIRRLIRGMSLANRLWGAPRIHGELLKLGIDVAQSTVAKYMAKGGEGGRRPGRLSCTTMRPVSAPWTS